MVPTYSVFAGAINKAVKGTLHFSHIYRNGELKAFEEHLLIKCYNRFVRHPNVTIYIFQIETGRFGDPGPFRCCNFEAQGAEGNLPPTSPTAC